MKKEKDEFKSKFDEIDRETAVFYCPAIEKEIDFDDCIDIQQGANCGSTRGLAKEVDWTNDKKRVCLNCHYRCGACRAILWGGREVFVQRYNDGGIYATEATEPKDWKWFRITKFHIKKWLEDTPMNVCLRLGMHHWF
ncbi:MAG: hypothetical protein IJ306_07105 [Oscillospiraceae bacterium]|nr:hypothetical protein [Oscillospiraceae bacterium]